MVIYDKSFATHPKSKFWSKKNKDLPKDVYKQSSKKYIFDCDCGHEFVISLNKISFNNGSLSASPFFGNTKALGVWKEALTDAELRSLTYPTPTAPTFDLDFNTIATDFTFTRNSEATFVNAQGLIQSTNELGAEEIINGDFAISGTPSTITYSLG